jgi:hypothetical protein
MSSSSASRPMISRVTRDSLGRRPVAVAIGGGAAFASSPLWRSIAFSGSCSCGLGRAKRRGQTPHPRLRPTRSEAEESGKSFLLQRSPVFPTADAEQILSLVEEHGAGALRPHPDGELEAITRDETAAATSAARLEQAA